MARRSKHVFGAVGSAQGVRPITVVVGLALVFMLAACTVQARVLPGTQTTVLPDGTVRVVTDGRPTLFMDFGVGRVALRLGPDSRSDEVVLLDTPVAGRVAYSLDEIAPDTTTTAEIHMGALWMARYAVDASERVLLLAVDDVLGKMFAMEPSESRSVWVALSLADGSRIPVDADLVLRTHLASSIGREALADDLKRDPVRVDRLAALVASSDASAAARLLAMQALELVGRELDVVVARRIMEDSRIPDLEVRRAAAELFARARGAGARGPLVAVARRGSSGDGFVAGAGLAALARRDFVRVEALRRLIRAPRLETRLGGLYGLAGASWVDAAEILMSGAHDPSSAAAVAASLCEHGDASWNDVVALVEGGGPAAAPLLRCLDPSREGGLGLVLRASGGGGDGVHAVQEALWRSSAPTAVRLAAIDALLALAHDPDGAARVALLRGAVALAFDGDGFDAVVDFVKSVPGFPWAVDMLSLMVDAERAGSLDALVHIARGAEESAVASAAQELVLKTRWAKDLHESRRKALVDLWTARPDLVDFDLLREVLRRNEQGSVALLMAFRASTAGLEGGGASELLYSTDWRGKAAEAFMKHLLQSAAPIPWTVALVERIHTGKMLNGETVQLLCRAVGEGDSGVSKRARVGLAEGLFSVDSSADPEVAESLIGLVRSGSRAAARTAREVLERQRWTGEAKVRVDSFAAESGVRRAPTSRERIERLRRHLQQEGVR